MSEQNAALHRRLIQLGDMMGDGLHHEADGRWITKEYRQTLKALGILPKRKVNTDQIDKLMMERLKVVKCQRCNGTLEQTRKGSMRGKCVDCGSMFQLMKRKKVRR